MIKVRIRQIAVLLVVASVITYITWQSDPSKPVIPVKVPPAYSYKFGVLSPKSPSVGDFYYDVLAKSAQRDSVDYLRSINLNESYNFTFKVYGVDESESADMYTENEIVGMKSMGMSDVIGGFTRDQLSASTLHYVAENNMVFFSPSLTVGRSLDPSGRGYAGFLSLVPNATSRARSFASPLLKSGLNVAIIIQPVDEERRSEFNNFSSVLIGSGGAAVTVDASTALPELEEAASEATRNYPKSQVFILGWHQSKTLEDLRPYPTLSNMTWVDLGNDSFMRENWSSYGDGFRVFDNVQKWYWGGFNYELQSGKPLNQTLANTYDAMMLFSRAFVYSRGDVYHASDFIESIHSVSRGYFGLTGDCSLNAQGDRDHVDYELILMGTRTVVVGNVMREMTG